MKVPQTTEKSNPNPIIITTTQLSPIMSSPASLKDDFEKAVKLASCPDIGGRWPLTMAQKGTMYGCFKQVTVGPCDGSRPGLFAPVARQKYDAWKEVSTLSKEEAMSKYIALVEQFAPEFAA